MMRTYIRGVFNGVPSRGRELADEGKKEFQCPVTPWIPMPATLVLPAS